MINPPSSKKYKGSNGNSIFWDHSVLQRVSVVPVCCSWWDLSGIKPKFKLFASKFDCICLLATETHTWKTLILCHKITHMICYSMTHIYSLTERIRHILLHRITNSLYATCRLIFHRKQIRHTKKHTNSSPHKHTDNQPQHHTNSLQLNHEEIFVCYIPSDLSAGLSTWTMCHIDINI